jgi:hypothetical protein
MKRTGNKTGCAGFFLAMAASVMVMNAAGSDNSYQSIASHGSFDLRPVPAAAVQNLQTPPEVVLNGITTIFGDKRALFKVLDAPPAHTSRSYFLSEGERNGDVELLAVDVKAGTIKVIDQGIVQVITICKAPALLAISNKAMGSDASVESSGDRNNYGTASVASTAKSGNESQGEMPSPAAGQPASAGNAVKSASDSNGNSPGNTGDRANDSSSSNASDTAASATQDNPWWMKEAQKIEQARQETAQRVMDGKWQPYPLTPLTPPGTPSQLISSASEYFFYNPLASSD